MGAPWDLPLAGANHPVSGRVGERAAAGWMSVGRHGEMRVASGDECGEQCDECGEQSDPTSHQEERGANPLPSSRPAINHQEEGGAKPLPSTRLANNKRGPAV